MAHETHIQSIKNVEEEFVGHSMMFESLIDNIPYIFQATNLLKDAFSFFLEYISFNLIRV